MSVRVSFVLNGESVSADVSPRTLLVEMIRENLGRTGTHVGCDTSQCGACVVHLNGRSIKSCTMLAVQAEGADVANHRRCGIGWRIASDAGGISGTSWIAVRILHARHDHECARSRRPKSGPERAANQGVARGQSVPLHRLSKHRARG